MSDFDSSVQRQIDSICVEFRKQWAAEIRPDFKFFLAKVDESNRERLLNCLVDSDVELRLAAGHSVNADEYRPLGDHLPQRAFEVISQSTLTATASIDNMEGTRRIGPFKLLQRIGEGGMGTVWMADQQEPVKRRVALKVIKAGMDTKQVIARFEAERQALAMMDHQNIAKVLDAGMTDDGRPYFAMELVQGISINEYCDRNKLSLNDRLALFVPVCQAVQHAHQKGIIHRDLKPSNVLVNLYDGKPVPKVIDFGLAKALQHQTQLTDRTMFTEFGQVVGTLQYMSPEQAEMNALDVDTRTDIYSLGVMLYELLTGSTPLDQKTLRGGAWDKILKAIREEEPSRPSTRLSESGDAIAGISEQRMIAPAKLQQILRGELDWVVMKALEKDRSRRYETANGLAADVQRYLDDEPVVARPPSTGYRVKKFVRRNKRFVATSAAFVVVLIGAVAVSWFYELDARMARDKAERKTIEVTQQKERADRSARRAEDVLKIVTDSFRSTSPVKGSDADMTAREVLFNARKSLKSSDLDDLGKAALLEVLTTSFLGVGEYGSAISTAEDLIAIRKVKLGEDHPDTLTAMNNLATAYRLAGRIDDGIGLAERTLALRKAKLGEDHPQTLASMYNLAASYRQAERVDEAIELDERTLALRKARLGEHHHQTLTSMNNLAAGYREAGRLDEAIGLDQRTLALRKARLGGDHPQTLRSMNNLADGYRQAGRLDEAIELDERTLTLRKAKLGEDHPDTLTSMNNLAAGYREAGRLDEALELMVTAVELMNEKLGPDHIKTLSAMNGLAVVYAMVGEFDEAIDVAEQLVARRLNLLGAHHPKTNAAELALANYKQGAIWLKVAPLPSSTNSSISLNELEQWRRISNQYPQASFFNTLGVAEFRVGNHEQAIVAAKHAIKIREDSDNPQQHPADLAILAMSHHKLGNDFEAEKYHQQLDDAMKLDEFKDDEDCKSFLAEANVLFDGQ